LKKKEISKKEEIMRERSSGLFGQSFDLCEAPIEDGVYRDPRRSETVAIVYGAVEHLVAGLNGLAMDVDGAIEHPDEYPSAQEEELEELAQMAGEEEAQPSEHEDEDYLRALETYYNERSPIGMQEVAIRANGDTRAERLRRQKPDFAELRDRSGKPNNGQKSMKRRPRSRPFTDAEREALRKWEEELTARGLGAEARVLLRDFDLGPSPSATRAQKRSDSPQQLSL